MKKIPFILITVALSFGLGCNEIDDVPPSENGDTQTGTQTPDNGQTPGHGTVDPCKGVSCVQGVCIEGICVTDEMKQIPDEAVCDPETFVSFCDGNRTVYCDNGIVISGTCDEGCVVYDETFHGRTHRMSGCVDGGACTSLNALKRSCSVVSGLGQVLATACQMTTRGTMQWVSVDGYYCQGECDSHQEKCALQEGECDPYDAANYFCDRKTLHTCQFDSNLTAHQVTRYCQEACVPVNGIAMCGYSCDTEGARDHYCVTVGQSAVEDLGDFVCTKADDGNLYSVWTEQYEFCMDGCNATDKTCK